MISTAADDRYKRMAVNRLPLSIEFEKRLPERVFPTNWTRFRFFESDRIFVGPFVGVLHGLLAAEGGTTVCMANLTAKRSVSDVEIANIFVDVSSTEAEFVTQLRGDGPASGWLYAMDRYACGSDVGRWSIYCEKENDIAVIAFQDDRGVVDFRHSIDDLRAWHLDAIGDDPSIPFPLNSLTPTWREALRRNYTQAT